MPTTPLERLLFLQGNQCFFCNRQIPRDQASIEHLVPQSLQGTNNMNNLVACCKTLNGIFGNLSLKEKLRVILMQKGEFVCPNAPKEQPQQPAQLPQKGQGQQQKALPAPKNTPPPSQEKKNGQQPQERLPERKTQYPPYPGPSQPVAETSTPQPLPEAVKEEVAETPTPEPAKAAPQSAPKAASQPSAKTPAGPAPKTSSQGAGKKTAKTPRLPAPASGKSAPAAAKAAAVPAALPAPEIKPEGNVVQDDPDQWKLFEIV